MNAVLTRRQRQVCDLAARGRTNSQIADALGLATNTVKTYLQDAYAQLGVTNRTEMAVAFHAAAGRPATDGGRLTGGDAPGRPVMSRDALLDRIRMLTRLARVPPGPLAGRLRPALARLTPPVDADGPGWAHLVAAVRVHDEAVRPPAASQDALDIARRGVVLAAAGLVGVDELRSMANHPPTVAEGVV